MSVKVRLFLSLYLHSQVYAAYANRLSIYVHAGVCILSWMKAWKSVFCLYAVNYLLFLLGLTYQSQLVLGPCLMPGPGKAVSSKSNDRNQNLTNKRKMKSLRVKGKRGK